MLDLAGTWKAALPPRVQAEMATIEGTLRRACQCDIPRRPIRVVGLNNVALSFLFLSRVAILSCVCGCYVFGEFLGRRSAGSSRRVMAALHSLRSLISRPQSGALAT